MFQLVEVKSLGGVNYVKPELVVALQSAATGGTVIVMVGGALVNSSENAKIIAERLAAAIAGAGD